MYTPCIDIRQIQVLAIIYFQNVIDNVFGPWPISSQAELDATPTQKAKLEADSLGELKWRIFGILLLHCLGLHLHLVSLLKLAYRKMYRNAQWFCLPGKKNKFYCGFACFSVTGKAQIQFAEQATATFLMNDGSFLNKWQVRIRS